MNLLKKIIFTILISGLLVSCEEEDTAGLIESSTGTGLTEITFPSNAITVKIEDGDGTVRPQGLGVTSYVVDFGDLNSTSDIVTITEDAGTASYDYPNDRGEFTYTITVTAKSNQGFSDVVQTKNVTITHEVNALFSAPLSPNILNENVYAIFSDGIETSGVFAGYKCNSRF